ncbi:hypothetical protein ACEPAI_5468 [Sanghuangporus weigelae]
MSIHIFSPHELEDKLQELARLLPCLPANIPTGNKYYNFEFFEPDPVLIEDYGLDGAVNHGFEIVFAPEGRRTGITFMEQGPGLTAVVDVLRNYNTKFPGHAVLQKWVLDLLDSSIKAIEAVESSRNIPIDPVLLDSIDGSRKRKQTSPDENTEKKKLKFDVGMPKKKGRGGRPADPLLDKLRILYFADQTEKYRCAGEGCPTVWEKKSGYRDRVFRHAANCFYIPKDLQQRVNGCLKDRSLGQFFEDQQNSDKPSESQTAENRKTGTSLKAVAEQCGREQLIKKINFAVLKVICACGIPPSIVDRKEWKDLLCIANPKYDPPSSKTFTDSLIPAEHAFVKSKQLEHLQTCENLTISFDGGTTTGLQSIYTVHVITPQRRAFLVEGSQASLESHTAGHLFGVLNSVIKTIGPERFRGITSDNTGNTSAARRLVQETYPWIIILPDPCHRLNLLCKDIGKIEAFSEVIAQVQRIVQYFHKSTNGTSQLKLRRRELGISQGIKSVGKTRFGTVYYAALSVERNYAALVELFKDGKIKSPDIENYFLPGFAASSFSFGLQRLTMVLSPVAKALTCLESSHSTVADVYLFWLAVSSGIHRMLSQGGLCVADSEKIRRAVNYRFNQMINDAPSDVYITGFVLDPRFRKVHVLNDLNPLEIPKVKIPARDTSSRQVCPKPDEKIPQTLVRVGNFLLSLLREHYKSLSKDISGFKQSEARLRLPRQILEYQKAEYPFNSRFRRNGSAGEWWAKLDKNPDAQPLAKLARSLFEVLPNSMSDERTASTFTWMNTPLRNKQDAATLVRMATVREWYRFDPNKRPEPFRPTVKFCDMTEYLFRGKAPSPAVSSAEPPQPNTTDSNEVVFDAKEVNFNNFVEGDVSDESEMDNNAYNFSGDKLDLENQINMESSLLRDVLSEQGIDPSILVTETNTNNTQNESNEDDSDDLKDDDLWKMG